jgi:tetratricopeptide (TPR) repeat protein
MDTAEAPASSRQEEFRDQLQLALAQRVQGDLPTATEALRSLVASDEANPGLRCELAYTLMLAGALDEAQDLCLAVVEQDPTFPPALACLGHVYKARGESEAALDWYQRAVAAGLATPPILAEVAGRLAALSRFEEAEAMFYEVLVQAPRWKAALHGLAHAYRSLNRPAAALFFYRLLAEADPGVVAAHCEVGATLAGLGRLDEADEAYRQALATAPDLAAPYRGVAHVARLRGRPQEAADIMEEARARGVLDVEGLVLLAAAHTENAVALSSEGKTTAALDALRRAIDADPDHFDAALLLARLSRQFGQWQACRHLGEAMMRTRPDRIEGYAEACRALIAQGRWEEAAGVAQDLPSTEFVAGERLALRLEVARACLDSDLAQEALSEAEPLAEGDVEVWAGAVETRLAFGDAAAARAGLARAPAPETAFQTARLRRLEAALAALEWRMEEAREGYEAALALHADNPQAHEALSRLHLLRADADASMRHLGVFLEQARAARAALGQSARLSQNLVGQLVNELRMDADLQAALGALPDCPTRSHLGGKRASGGEESVETLLGLARRFPEATPVAMALLLALRRAGRLGGWTRLPETDGAPTIPAAIVQFWPHGDPPARVWRTMNACRELHPDWRYAYFNRATAEEYVRGRFPADVQAAYQRAAETGQADHLFRLAYLFAEGGYWVGAGDRCIASLAALGRGGVSFVGYQDEISAISGALLGCAPGEPLVCRALDQATAALNRGDNDIPWLATGPGLMTRAFGQMLSEPGADWRAALQGIFIADRVDLCDVLVPGGVFTE